MKQSKSKKCWGECRKAEVGLKKDAWCLLASSRVPRVDRMLAQILHKKACFIINPMYMQLSPSDHNFIFFVEKIKAKFHANNTFLLQLCKVNRYCYYTSDFSKLVSSEKLRYETNMCIVCNFYSRYFSVRYARKYT